ncbi:MAG: glucan biosynthesis protein [Paracoccaceae bacterium]|uniref:glucan biosynthesis protein n=1 Tax=Seohaeicola saemankumensis TaxID=481181 RepID=UPI001E4CF2EF|nr:glucan biosynthesis protein G [Seohaeicola saemankumensis]MCD1625385.1 glucan biosynthesis protein G [Seohaeicola saemankumensis]
MSVSDHSFPLFSRRCFLTATAALASTFPLRLTAQESGSSVDTALQQFSFDILSEEMRQLAEGPYQPAPEASGFISELDYDDYRLVRFRPDRQRWATETSTLTLAAFPMGWLFKEPVILYEVADGAATEMRFTTEDFEYLNDLAERIPPMTDMPGVAGFRLHHPLNRPDVMDELVAFVGASYFRALGRGSAYGLSARGLALNTASTSGEEFPRFSRFYMERGTGPGAITVYAAMQSPSVTGAYRFVFFPGATTTIEVTARLYFREDVEELGVAPLTSMYLYSEKNHTQFDDFRPKVHDSDGLYILRADGETIWRPLNNPPRLSGSYFAETAPRRFGLHQRDRDFESYQDTEANYHRRPSLDIEPIGDWGNGHVRLVEIPSELEANDNIVAYWVPEAPARAGDAREFAYRMHWGDLPVDPDAAIAHVETTRAGHGGVAGVELEAGLRKFVVDFRGGFLDRLGPDADIAPIVTIANGEMISTVLQRVPQNGVWRLFIDMRAGNDAVVELSAHLAGYDRKLTENWLYQWINAI